LEVISNTRPSFVTTTGLSCKILLAGRLDLLHRERERKRKRERERERKRKRERFLRKETNI